MILYPGCKIWGKWQEVWTWFSMHHWWWGTPQGSMSVHVPFPNLILMGGAVAAEWATAQPEDQNNHLRPAHNMKERLQAGHHGTTIQSQLKCTYTNAGVKQLDTSGRLYWCLFSTCRLIWNEQTKQESVCVTIDMNLKPLAFYELFPSACCYIFCPLAGWNIDLKGCNFMQLYWV